MNTYLVADGGGTKTEFLWFCEDGFVLSAAKTGASNAIFISPQTAALHVAQGIRSCIAAAENRPYPRLILLFIPGFSDALPFLRAQIRFAEILLMDDFWNAFYGARGKPYGIVALAGTGSFVAGRRDAGDLLTIGGWGPMIGDEGSGYRMGVLCLQAVTKRYDDGKANSLLTKLLLHHMGIRHVIELQKAAYAADVTREQVAKLSFVVERAAQEGDPEAVELFNILAAELVEQVVRLARRLEDPALPVSVTGGMTKAGAWYTDAFYRSLAQQAPALVYTPPKYSPLIGGALYLLQEKLGKDITDGQLAERIAGGVNSDMLAVQPEKTM